MLYFPEPRTTNMNGNADVLLRNYSLTYSLPLAGVGVVLPVYGCEGSSCQI